MLKEKPLNKYYNLGKFNNARRIGYMMKIIRDVDPETIEDWQAYYFANVNPRTIMDELTEELHQYIPSSEGVTKDMCRDYIYDVMFRRTFEGHLKEKQAEALLKKLVSPNIQKAPKEWDNRYFIDFYVKSDKDILIGIQLKPETFYSGRYYNKVNIEGKLKAFRDDYNAKTFVLTYKQKYDNNEIEFCDYSVIEEIKAAVHDADT